MHLSAGLPREPRMAQVKEGHLGNLLVSCTYRFKRAHIEQGSKHASSYSFLRTSVVKKNVKNNFLWKLYIAVSSVNEVVKISLLRFCHLIKTVDAV